MKKTAGMKWGIYASIAVFMLLIVPVLVGAEGDTSGIPPGGGPPEPQQGLVPCDGVQDACTFVDFIELVDTIIDFLIYTIAVPLAAILFVWAGFLYTTAGGDPGKVKKATGIFKNVVGGLIIALAAWLGVNLIVTSLTTYDNAADVFQE